MPIINRESFIIPFREEVNDHIQEITQKLFQLEKQPGDHKLLVEELLRIAHTLKGSARMMGYPQISTLAHKMEDLFVELRDGHLELSPLVSDLVLYCLDTVQYLVEGMYKHVQRTADIDELVALFNDLIAGKAIRVPQIQSQGLKPPIKQPDAMSSADAEVSAEQLNEAKEQHYVRIHTQDLDTMLNLVGEVLLNQHRYDGQLPVFQKLLQDVQEHWQALAELQEIVRKGESPLSRSVLEDIADQLERMASQLLRNLKDLRKKNKTDGQHMHLTIGKLQEHVINVRMMPAARIFHLLPRLVRVTARRLGKNVELNLLGKETKIDHRIIQEMRDPLIHLVQNAIHHGIESPEERQLKGKSPTGTITVSAHQEGNRIILQVKDDGKGIDRDRIITTAQAMNILPAHDLHALSEQEAYELLFRPGFSTADAVDDIAGRGFGLNIVREHVDRVQGEIEVRSPPAQGTEFTLKLPATLTIINALLVRVGTETFAIPTISVEKSVDIPPDEIDQTGVKPVVRIDAAALPVVELRRILQIPDQPQNRDASAADYTVIIVTAEERRIALIVDDLVEEREIVVKPLSSCLKRVRNVAGATTIREDVVLILFARDLVRSAEMLLEKPLAALTAFSESGSSRETPGLHPKTVPRILIVDDSLNSREVERTILEDAGYLVDTAVTGAEGLKKLETLPFDLVVTDIEMPEVDGFQLIQQMKADEVLRTIPVIIVSTRGTEEEKRQGLQTGAAAYIAKGEFDEQTLLKTVAAYIQTRFQ